ncbi:hypothetical protein ACS0TY_024349 [Phlomoides rotata]
MEEAAEALNSIQAETALLGDTDDRLMAEVECNIRLNTALTQHQALSTQRNCLQWLQDDDRNSKFFYTMNHVRKTSTGLSSLLMDGVLSFDTKSIPNRVVDLFTELFTNHDQGTYDDSALGDFVLSSIDHVDNDYLSCLLSMDKIKRVAFDMEPSSAPGPNGFGSTFYHSCWDIIALDVIERSLDEFEML